MVDCDDTLILLTTRHRDGIREWHEVEKGQMIRICPDFAWTRSEARRSAAEEQK